MNVSNLSERLLKVGVLTFVTVVIEDMPAWSFKSALCQNQVY